MTNATENIGQPIQTTINNPNSDIWEETVDDFFGCGPQKDDNITQYASINDALDAVARCHEKPLVKNVEEKKLDDKNNKITIPTQTTQTKPKTKAKHVCKQPVREYVDEDDNYEYDEYDDDAYIKEKPSARFK